MSNYNNISNKFHLGVRWNLAGSIIYETIKAVHNFFLFNLINQATYGLLGSTLSIIYFSSKIADLGATSSLPPFFHYIMRNKQTFTRIMLKHYLLPHLPLVLLIATGSAIIYTNQFISSTTITIAIPIIISFEVVRYFLRIFLHAAFKSKAVVIIEVGLFMIFVALIWLPHILFGMPLTIKNILMVHIFDSVTCVAIFLVVLARFYHSLPSTAEPTSRPSIKRMTATKIVNYLLRISRDLFTSNFLTPLFALKCGLGQAGIFYFATIIVNTIQSTIKMSIHYPANGLLSNLKESPHITKKAAFSMLCQKLTKLLTPIIIFLMINHQFILSLSKKTTNITTNTLAMILLFLLITFIESFFLLYEQFYVIEEASTRLFMFKILEFILFYVFVIKNPSASIIVLISTVAAIKIFSFGLTALNAFSRWQLAPVIKPNVKAIIGWFVVSLLFSLFF